MFIILNKIWHLMYVNKHNHVLQRPDGSYALACTDQSAQIIYVSDHLKGKLLKKVLIHEVCHACVVSYDIKLNDSFEEYLCDYISKYAKDILRISEKIYLDKCGE